MLHTALEKIYTSRHEGQPSSSNLNISVISTTANKSDAAAQRLAVLGEKVNFKNDRKLQVVGIILVLIPDKKMYIFFASSLIVAKTSVVAELSPRCTSV